MPDRKSLKDLEERLTIKVEKRQMAHAGAFNGDVESNLYIGKSLDPLRIEKGATVDSKPIINIQNQGSKTEKIGSDLSDLSKGLEIEVIGCGVKRGSRIVENKTNARIVLKKDGKGKYILTGYPD